ncbi:MAG TPA: CoA-binding protein [Candidatus Binatia bacterium]|nr:CoA-binding protein [Candidatus Binatia bacterium]
MSILLDENSRVLIQGITGQQARTHVPYMIRYGTKVVAGVSPGKGGGLQDGIPVYDSVAAAKRDHQVDISVLFIPAPYAKDAALEAIENDIPLVVVLAEGVPHHDAAEMIDRATQKGARLIGPNSQGMISPGKAKLGGTGGAEPERLYQPGPVGIISRSGGMGGEIANALTRRGIGQSTYISIGGDLLIGTDFIVCLKLFEEDPQTQAVVIFGEPGTGHEEQAARFVSQGGFTKSLIALIAGESIERLPKGMSFGHTSSIIARGVGSTGRKKQLLREAGAHVADTFSALPGIVENALAGQR